MIATHFDWYQLYIKVVKVVIVVIPGLPDADNSWDEVEIYVVYNNSNTLIRLYFMLPKLLRFL